MDDKKVGSELEKKEPKVEPKKPQKQEEYLYYRGEKLKIADAQ